MAFEVLTLRRFELGSLRSCSSRVEFGSVPAASIEFGCTASLRALASSAGTASTTGSCFVDAAQECARLPAPHSLSVCAVGS